MVFEWLESPAEVASEPVLPGSALLLAKPRELVHARPDLRMKVQSSCHFEHQRDQSSGKRRDLQHPASDGTCRQTVARETCEPFVGETRNQRRQSPPSVEGQQQPLSQQLQHWLAML